LAPKTDSAVGAELPDADVSELDVLDSLEEDVTADPLLAAADEEAPDVVPAPVDACAPELAAVLPAVGIETPIFRDSSAAVRANRVWKSVDAAAGFEALPVAAAADTPSACEFMEVR